MTASDTPVSMIVVVVVAAVVFVMKDFCLRNLLRGEQPLDTQDDYTRYTSEYGGSGGVVVLAMKGFGLRNLLREEHPVDTQDDNTRYTSE